MAQGRLPITSRRPRIAPRSSGCPHSRPPIRISGSSLSKVELAKDIRGCEKQKHCERSKEVGLCATTSVSTSARAPTGRAYSTKKVR
jgi:hypothetical protein